MEQPVETPNLSPEAETPRPSAAEEIRNILKAKAPEVQPDVVGDEEVRSAEKLKKYLIRRRGSSN